MIQENKIRELPGVLGFEQPYNPTFAILEPDLLESLTGARFEQYSPYITVENIKETHPYPSISDSDLNAFLRKAIANATAKGLQSCFSGDDLKQSELLYKYEMRRVNPTLLENKGDFVGFELKTSKRKDLTNVVRKLVADFSGIGTVKVLLLNSASIQPVDSIEISIASKSATTKLVNWALPYGGEYLGGKWYIGYLNSGLTVNALDRNYDESNVKTNYLCADVEPIKVVGWDKEEMFDPEDVESTAETHGLNLDISTREDFTSVVIDNPELFKDVIGYQFAVDMVNQMLTTTTINDIQRLQRKNLLLELEGITGTDQPAPNIIGLHARLAMAIKKVRQSLKEQELITRSIL